jgi:hypothetical protein
METISDIITNDDLDRWKKGDMILIDAQTGRGKSYFVMNKLYEFCKKNNKRILFLTNRDLLKDQLLNLIKTQGKDDIIKTINYQKIENAIINHEPNTLNMSEYEFVIADECHYFFTNALFNRNTDLIIEFLETYYNSIVILLSATSLLTRAYFEYKNRLKAENIYSIKQDYSYISNLYFYSDEKVIEKLLLDLPEGEKAIYIAGAEKAFAMSKMIFDASFICSEWNTYYKKYKDQVTYDYIKNEEKFNCKVLCGTIVLDNGINIKDKTAKHIIIDVLDLSILKQCIGRKRIVDNEDTISVYIKVKNGRSLNASISQREKELIQVECLESQGEEVFRKVMYKKDISKAIELAREGSNWYKVNKIMFYKLKWDCIKLNSMLKENTKEDGTLGFKNAVCHEFNFNLNNTKILEDEFDEAILVDYFKTIIEVKLFQEDQKALKDYLTKELFSTLKSNHNSLGLKTINAIFEERKINYRIESKREKSGVNRDKTYWIINRL